MTTIAQLVIQASLEPSGVRQGLDQALGYTKQFAAQADVIFKSVGPGQDNVTKATQVLHRIESEFQLASNRMKEQFLRGALDPARYASEARQAGLAMNSALLAALEGFRSKGIFDNEAEAIFINRLRTDLNGVRQTSGGGVSDLSKTTGLIGDLGRLSHGGAAGLGLMRRELLSMFAQITGTIPVLDRLGNTLLSYQTGGAISFGVIAGLTAIAGAYYLITKSAREAAEENKKALDSIRAEIDKTQQHISERAVFAAETNVKAAQDKIDELNRTAAARAASSPAQQTLFPTISTGAISGASDADKAAMRDANRELAAAIQNRDRLRREANIQSGRDFDDELQTFIKHNSFTEAERKIALSRLKDYEDDAAKLRLSGADNARRAFDLEQAANLRDVLFPKKTVRDKEPFPELRAQIQNIATAYKDLRDQGIAPTITLQNEAEDQFTRLGHMIALLPDQTGRAARSLLEMQRLLLTSGIHANDALLTPKIQIGPPVGEEDKTAAELAKRAADMRAAINPLSEAALAALGAESRFLRVIDLRIEAAGGAEHASLTLLNARKTAVEDIDKAQKDMNPWTAEDQENLNVALQQSRTFLDSTRRLADGWNDVRAAIQGALDVLDALGAMNSNVRQIANGALHLASTLKQIQKDRDDRAKASATGGTGVDTSGAGAAAAIAQKGGAFSGLFNVIGSVGQYLGAIGAGISIITGVVGLFRHHNQALEDNTKKLQQLNESMVNTNGLRGQQQEQQALLNLRQLYNSPAFKMSSSGTKNQLIEDAVNKAGLSIDQFNKILHDFGIEPEKSTKWVEQFGEMLQKATEAAAKYADTLDDQRSLIDLHNKVFGKDTPQDAIQENIKLLNQFAPALGSAIAGIDTTTAEGQDQLRNALKNWVTLIENNAITPEMLDKLTGVKDFGAIILALSDSLDELAKKTDAATESMTNVPDWYKVNLRRWEVAAPMDIPGQMAVPTTPIPTQQTWPTIQPPRSLAPNAPTTVAATTGMSGGAPILFTGDITIQTQATDGESLFRTFLRVAQSKSAAQFGTTTKWSQLQSP